MDALRPREVHGGWLTTNPLEPLLTLVGAGQLPATAPGYATVARLIVATHADALLSVTIPFAEAAIAMALVSGKRVRTAALVACTLNANLLLFGVANSSLDGRMIVLQLLLVCTITMRDAVGERGVRRPENSAGSTLRPAL